MIVPVALACALVAAGTASAFSETDDEAAARLALQWKQFEAVRTKSIVELQPLRKSQDVTLKNGDKVRLISLNPAINAWFLLEVTSARTGKTETYHVENPKPLKVSLRLVSQPKPHLMIEGGRSPYPCVPWGQRNAPLERAREASIPFSPFCGGRLYLRNKTRGNRTSLEATSEFLRDNVWLGENLVGFVKDTFFRDSQFETAEEIDAEATGFAPKGLVKADLETTPTLYSRTGLVLEGTKSDRMTAGAWYAVAGLPGVYASTMLPRQISQDLLRDGGSARYLDSVESRAQVYLVAFDLGLFNLSYELGTDHPRLGWSSRPSGAGRNYSIPGPDGVARAAPLQNLGMVNPADARKVVGTFTGGFKRDHGAFRFGPKATSRNGYHYGFVVHGVVESKLHPDLSTLYVLNDGTIGMKTWTEADNAKLANIRFARQNGVALVERDPVTKKSMPGKLVPHWGPGNWSGSAEADLRTLRAGTCLRQADGKQFLIYAYFSTATPSALARTFQAYDCDHAMLMDMNAVEHTYSAVYVWKNGGLQTQHLVKNMAPLDKRKSDGSRIPRFVGFPDNRDFFYLTRKEEAAQ